jgi:hypothetical protein
MITSSAYQTHMFLFPLPSQDVEEVAKGVDNVDLEK